MSERTGSRRAWPAGFLGMIVIVAAVECSISRRSVDFVETSRSSWSLSGDAARTARDREIVCLGDSLIKHGLLPRVLAERTGMSTINLSVCAAQPPVAYYILKRLIDNGGEPRIAIVDFKPDLLAGGLRNSSSYWPEFATVREAIELAWTGRDARFLAETIVAGSLPSVRNRHEIAAAIRAALAGKTEPLRSVNLALWRNWGVNQGAEFTPKNPGFDGRIGEADLNKYMTKNFWCDKINRKYIERFLDLADRRGIRVVWLLPPISPGLQKLRGELGSDRTHGEFVRSFQKKHRGLIVFDARKSRYDSSMFLDPVHLDGEGGYALSCDVASMLNQIVESGSIAGAEPLWIDLPKFRPRPLDPRIENVEQSKIAVRDSTAESRRR